MAHPPCVTTPQPLTVQSAAALDVRAIWMSTTANQKGIRIMMKRAATTGRPCVAEYFHVFQSVVAACWWCMCCLKSQFTPEFIIQNGYAADF